MIIQPVDTDDVVTATAVFPVVFQKLIVGNSHLPFEIVRHQINNPLILRIFVIRLQTPEHDHLCPQFTFTVPFVDGAEVTVGLATGKYTFNPCFCFRNHLRIIQDIGKIAVTFQPVRDFFPTMIAAGRQPGIIVFLQPGTDLTQMSGQTFTLQFEILLYPTFRLNAANRQLNKIQRTKRSPIAHVIRVSRLCIGTVYHPYRFISSTCGKSSCQQTDSQQRTRNSYFKRSFLFHFEYFLG